MTDTVDMKKFLMEEYMEANGENPEEFMRGMVWLESLMLDTIGKKGGRLNDSLPRDEQLKILGTTIERMKKEMGTLTEENARLKEKIMKVAHSNGKVLRTLAVSKEVKRWKNNYNELMNKYLRLTGKIATDIK